MSAKLDPLEFCRISLSIAEEIRQVKPLRGHLIYVDGKHYIKKKYLKLHQEVTASLVNDIHEFHDKFDLKPADPAGDVDLSVIMFRLNFLREELHEFEDSLNRDNKEGMLDALVDLVYVAIGTAYLFGWPFNTAWQRVHNANMTKVRATDASASKRGSAFDVVKPKNWMAPDLSDLVLPIPYVDAITDAQLRML